MEFAKGGALSSLVRGSTFRVESVFEMKLARGLACGVQEGLRAKEFRRRA